MPDLEPARTEPVRPALLGVCYDEHSSFLRGAATAPPLIRKSLWSPHSNTWTETGFDLSVPGVLHDAGDIAPPDGPDALDTITRCVTSLLAQDFNPLTLGGDHTVTFPVLRAFAARYPQLTIVHFDAHPDLYDEYNGDRFSHACPLARVMEAGLAQRLIQVGIRTTGAHQRDQAARFGVEMVEMRDLGYYSRLEFHTPVYVTFDIDGLDPSCAPGVSHREPGGLSVRQALDIIQSIDAPVVGADVVEFNPMCDIDRMTQTVAAKLVKELVGMMLRRPRGYTAMLADPPPKISS